MRCEAERNEFEEMIEDFEASGTTVISAFRLNRAGENLMLSKLALEMEFSTGKNPSRWLQSLESSPVGSVHLYSWLHPANILTENLDPAVAVLHSSTNTLVFYKPTNISSTFTLLALPRNDTCFGDPPNEVIYHPIYNWSCDDLTRSSMSYVQTRSLTISGALVSSYSIRGDFVLLYLFNLHQPTSHLILSSTDCLSITPPDQSRDIIEGYPSRWSETSPGLTT